MFNDGEGERAKSRMYMEAARRDLGQSKVHVLASAERAKRGVGRLEPRWGRRSYPFSFRPHRCFLAASTVHCTMAAPTRSQPRLKSLSLSSSSTPFQGGASSPPSPGGRNKALHKSSSIADLRQGLTTISKHKFLKRFTSKDKDLFGCAGEEGAATGAFSSARGSSDLDLDEMEEEEDVEMREVSFRIGLHALWSSVAPGGALQVESNGRS